MAEGCGSARGIEISTSLRSFGTASNSTQRPPIVSIPHQSIVATTASYAHAHAHAQPLHSASVRNETPRIKFCPSFCRVSKARELCGADPLLAKKTHLFVPRSWTKEKRKRTFAKTRLPDIYAVAVAFFNIPRVFNSAY